MGEGWGYVIAGYSFVFIGLIAYTTAVIMRGRSLSKQVPPDQRRFLNE